VKEGDLGIIRTLEKALRVDEWNIGVADVKLEEMVSDHAPGTADTIRPRVRWLPKPWFVCYQADPCLVEEDGRLFLYYEEVPFGTMRGRLRAGEFDAGRTASRLGGPMIRLHHHAAYPYVFKHSDVFYCVPDTGESDRVALYQSDAPLGPWTRHSILLDGVAARDSTIVFFGDRWWLFSSVAGNDPASAHANLHIWHAPEPWGPWEPHALQPAKKDLRSARPAGRPFVVNGALYRPAQDCWPRYGARTVIHRVLTLTPDSFVEEACCYLEPDPSGPYDKGLHTVTSAGGVVIVDGNCVGMTPNPFKTVMMIIAKVRQKYRRFGRR
jgi:hypothetical protein